MDQAVETTDKRLQRGAESRRLILQAAIDSIAMEGLGRLTLDRVADRVGISRGLVVFHFKSKNKLIEEVLDYLGLEFSQGWYQILEAKGEDDVSKLLRLIDYDLDFACEHPKYVSAWQAFWGDTKGNDLFNEKAVQRDREYSADLERLLENISDAGNYDKRNLPMITRGLVAMLFGIWTLLNLDFEAGNCSNHNEMVRLYLRRMFPDTGFPSNPPE